MHPEDGPQILVDADACPVKGEITRAARQFVLKVLLFVDTSHQLLAEYGEVITVEKGRDSVDIALINRTRRGDIVVTQDYGLAAMAVGRGAFALHPAGFVYHEGNLDRLLFERHLHGKIRSAGGRTKGPKKRHPEEDMRFREALERVCRNAVQSQK